MLLFIESNSYQLNSIVKKERVIYSNYGKET